MDKKYGIIGYRFGFGGYKAGAEYGPDTLRGVKLVERLKALGKDVSDLGSTDLNFNSQSACRNNIKNHDNVAAALRDINSRTKSALEAGYFPIILGGDHTVSLGTYSAFKSHYAGKKIGLLWIDTHPDLNTPETTTSKNAHGMTIAFLTGIAPTPLIPEFPQSPLDFKQIVYVGLRDIDAPEKELIRKHNLTAYTMKDVDSHGAGKIMDQALSQVMQGTEGFIVSFDLDAVDPALAPGTGTPIRGGLTYRESHLMVEMCYETGKMLGFELVELNPSLDINDQTADFGASLIESAVGKSIM